MKCIILYIISYKRCLYTIKLTTLKLYIIKVPFSKINIFCFSSLQLRQVFHEATNSTRAVSVLTKFEGLVMMIKHKVGDITSCHYHCETNAFNNNKNIKLKLTAFLWRRRSGVLGWVVWRESRVSCR